jgi:Raf kinase inhibitor-like YbhB/YbcL family protein
MSARAIQFAAAALLAGFLTPCHADNSPTNGVTMKLQLTSTAFAEGQPIPRRHAYDDLDHSPALRWAGVPPTAKSLALICDDPDAPAGVWVHWVVYNLPPSSTGLVEDQPKAREFADGAKQGVNDYKQIGYGGPCPPPGKPHRYFFKLYALDVLPELKPGLTKKELLLAMEGHVVAEGQLLGTYQRK